ncbi:hypothetical protein CA984_37445 [Streptosporangium minutum]|uniref:Uncharacterized protein n=1 Tax=Streptosporangium minutum TaxID=569862 RepID=A0A243R273_9ACTN|nr:hypothetical protein CA984_37445 [Streptosporangium minutum]
MISIGSPFNQIKIPRGVYGRQRCTPPNPPNRRAGTALRRRPPERTAWREAARGRRDGRDGKDPHTPRPAPRPSPRELYTPGGIQETREHDAGSTPRAHAVRRPRQAADPPLTPGTGRASPAPRRSSGPPRREPGRPGSDASRWRRS